jgi:hypothetical protein
LNNKNQFKIYSNSERGKEIRPTGVCLYDITKEDCLGVHVVEFINENPDELTSIELVANHILLIIETRLNQGKIKGKMEETFP